MNKTLRKIIKSLCVITPAISSTIAIVPSYSHTQHNLGDVVNDQNTILSLVQSQSVSGQLKVDMSAQGNENITRSQILTKQIQQFVANMILTLQYDDEFKTDLNSIIVTYDKNTIPTQDQTSFINVSITLTQTNGQIVSSAYNNNFNFVWVNADTSDWITPEPIIDLSNLTPAQGTGRREAQIKALFALQNSDPIEYNYIQKTIPAFEQAEDVVAPDIQKNKIPYQAAIQLFENRLYELLNEIGCYISMQDNWAVPFYSSNGGSQGVIDWENFPFNKTGDLEMLQDGIGIQVANIYNDQIWNDMWTISYILSQFDLVTDSSTLHAENSWFLQQNLFTQIYQDHLSDIDNYSSYNLAGQDIPQGKSSFSPALKQKFATDLAPSFSMTKDWTSFGTSAVAFIHNLFEMNYIERMQESTGWIPSNINDWTKRPDLNNPYDSRENYYPWVSANRLSLLISSSAWKTSSGYSLIATTKIIVYPEYYSWSTWDFSQDQFDPSSPMSLQMGLM